uniref:Uncharacterized protein n=1 Tax=Romanomermis culicivorax TaxID=13658 RepID=A0A915KBN3_ROMCU
MIWCNANSLSKSHLSPATLEHTSATSPRYTISSSKRSSIWKHPLKKLKSMNLITRPIRIAVSTFTQRSLLSSTFKIDFHSLRRCMRTPCRAQLQCTCSLSRNCFDRPTGVKVEPADEELLDRPIFNLNIAKLRPSTDASALHMLPPPSDITATTTQITDFLKLTLDEISTLTLVRMDEFTPIQPATMDTETTTITDKTLTNIPEESMVDQSMSMDVIPIKPPAPWPPTAPAMDPRIYLTTPAVLPGPRIIATIAVARYSAPVRFPQHIISDHQWQALAAAYHFPSLPPSMLFPEHHWINYPDALKEEIQCILLQQPTPATPVPQIAQRAPVIAQTDIQTLVALPQPIALQPPWVPQPPQPETLLPPMAPVDVQTPQAPSTSTPALDRHGQPI